MFVCHADLTTNCCFVLVAAELLGIVTVQKPAVRVWPGVDFCYMHPMISIPKAFDPSHKLHYLQLCAIKSAHSFLGARPKDVRSRAQKTSPARCRLVRQPHKALDPLFPASVAPTPRQSAKMVNWACFRAAPRPAAVPVSMRISRPAAR